MAQVKDPVCGMMIEENDAAATSDYRGQRYYFCSNDCKVEFDENPEDYATAGTRAAGGSRDSGDSPRA